MGGRSLEKGCSVQRGSRLSLERSKRKKKKRKKVPKYSSFSRTRCAHMKMWTSSWRPFPDSSCSVSACGGFGGFLEEFHINFYVLARFTLGNLAICFAEYRNTGNFREMTAGLFPCWFDCGYMVLRRVDFSRISTLKWTSDPPGAVHALEIWMIS